MKWVQFFVGAGIPEDLAKKYALTFTQHRIQRDMLPDLSKEILYDMGIKTIGDVIAILRHSKEVDEDELKAKVLESEKESKRPVIKINSGGSNRTSSGPSASSSNPDIWKRLSKLPEKDSRIASGGKRSLESSTDSGAVKIKRTISPPPEHDSREVRRVTLPISHSKPAGLPTATKANVFNRLGGSGSGSTSSSSSRTVISGSRGPPKATATVKPTTITIARNGAGGGLAKIVTPDLSSTMGASVRSRLGGNPNSSGLQVVSSNIRFKNGTKSEDSGSRRVVLNKNVFDRLGH
jgi:hypothetical protein